MLMVCKDFKAIFLTFYMVLLLAMHEMCCDLKLMRQNIHWFEPVRIYFDWILIMRTRLVKSKSSFIVSKYKVGNDIFPNLKTGSRPLDWESSWSCLHVTGTNKIVPLQKRFCNTSIIKFIGSFTNMFLPVQKIFFCFFTYYSRTKSSIWCTCIQSNDGIFLYCLWSECKHIQCWYCFHFLICKLFLWRLHFHVTTSMHTASIPGAIGIFCTWSSSTRCLAW